MRLGIMGGTFDPIHLGHLAIAERAGESLGLDSVLFIPAGEPWLRGGAKISPARHRLRMVELAVEGNPHFSVSRIEIDRPGATYTVDTLEALREEYGDGAALFFIMGSDALQSIDRWKDPERLLELCSLAVFDRPGDGAAEALPGRLLAQFPKLRDSAVWMGQSPVDISSTGIRRRLSCGRSVRCLVPERVEEYIREHRLYDDGEAPPA